MMIGILRKKQLPVRADRPSSADGGGWLWTDWPSPERIKQMSDKRVSRIKKEIKFFINQFQDNKIPLIQTKVFLRGFLYGIHFNNGLPLNKRNLLEKYVDSLGVDYENN